MGNKKVLKIKNQSTLGLGTIENKLLKARIWRFNCLAIGVWLIGYIKILLIDMKIAKSCKEGMAANQRRSGRSQARKLIANKDF